MADVDVLLTKLEAYHGSVNRHLQTLDAEFRELQIHWRALSEQYGGKAAEQFKAHWAGVSDVFEKHVQRGGEIGHALGQSIDDLRELARLREV
jgi:uncharacterized protein YukE